jgi:hypothetical protein
MWVKVRSGARYIQPDVESVSEQYLYPTEGYMYSHLKEVVTANVAECDVTNRSFKINPNKIIARSQAVLTKHLISGMFWWDSF